MTPQRAIPAPTPTPDTEPFWNAARTGRFLLPRCRTCNETHWYPRPVCPHCLGDATDWFEAKGTGTIYTFSIMHRAPEPYAIAYVTLDEGPTMLTNITNCDLAAIRIGARVQLAWHPTENGPPVPCFTLAGE